MSENIKEGYEAAELYYNNIDPRLRHYTASEHLIGMSKGGEVMFFGSGEKRRTLSLDPFFQWVMFVDASPLSERRILDTLVTDPELAVDIYRERVRVVHHIEQHRETLQLMERVKNLEKYLKR